MHIANDKNSPEYYFNIPKDEEVSTEVLSCIIARADAITNPIGNNFNGKSDTYCNEILSNAVWALSGLLEQAEIIIDGKHKGGQS